MTAKKKNVLPEELDNFKKFFDNLTPEKLREFQEKMIAGVKEREAERKKKAETPPETKTGTCVICQGKVVGEYERAVSNRNYYTGRDQIHGVPRHVIWHFKGYHCEKCGLCYKFPT